jgi:hypothetical protein
MKPTPVEAEIAAEMADAFTPAEWAHEALSARAAPARVTPVPDAGSVVMSLGGTGA